MLFHNCNRKLWSITLGKAGAVRQKSPIMKEPESPTHYCIIESPIGKLLLAASGKHLTRLSFQNGKHPIKLDPAWIYDQQPFQKTIEQLKAYFSGKRKHSP